MPLSKSIDNLELRYNYAWLLVAAILTNLGINVLNFIGGIVIKIIKKIKAKCKKKKEIEDIDYSNTEVVFT